MENSMRFGLMAVFAVSGSMVLLVQQVHKRLLSNFMKKFEYEMGGILCPRGQNKLGGFEKNQAKKKVRFAKPVMELPLESKSCHRRKVTRAQGLMAEEVAIMQKIQKCMCGPKLEDIMPPNRAVLYRGILKCKKGRFRC